MPSYRKLLFFILILYFALGIGYALLTPLWQAPDEPAHFNNILFIAQNGRLPVLQPGDYDQVYLEKLKSSKFPADMSVAPVRYEAHQPPLYYLLMTPFYQAVQGADLAVQVWALRLLNVFIGGVGLFFIWLSARRLFPDHPQMALLAAGFAAFLPMHIAMNAAINNDALSELFIVIGMHRLLGHLRADDSDLRAWGLTGLVAALGLLTKFQAYILIPLAGMVWLWQLGRMWRQRSFSVRRWLSGVALAFPILILPLPWWLRNMRIYGPTDLFGLQRHSTVVVGQPRTTEWIASQGLASYLERLVTFTFRSFWGVFGWMGVFLDARIYLIFTLLTALILAGAMHQIWRWRQHSTRFSDFQKWGMTLLGLQLLAVLAAFLWYNLDFVQHQGRYLFPALLPISLCVAGGLLGLFSVSGGRWGVAVALMLFTYWLAVGVMVGHLDKWALLFSLLAAAMLTLRRLLRQVDSFWWALATEGLMALIALYALFGAILPQLG